MKTVVVDPVRLGDGQHPQPTGLVHRRITGQGKEAAIEFASEEDGAAVDGELVSPRGEAAHAEVDGPMVTVRYPVGCRFKTQIQTEQRRLKLVPERDVVAWLIGEFYDVLSLGCLKSDRLGLER